MKSKFEIVFYLLWTTTTTTQEGHVLAHSFDAVLRGLDLCAQASSLCVDSL